jgi:hypothetical protein
VCVCVCLTADTGIKLTSRLDSTPRNVNDIWLSSSTTTEPSSTFTLMTCLESWDNGGHASLHECGASFCNASYPCQLRLHPHKINTLPLPLILCTAFNWWHHSSKSVLSYNHQSFNQPLTRQSSLFSEAKNLINCAELHSIYGTKKFITVFTIVWNRSLSKARWFNPQPSTILL